MAWSTWSAQACSLPLAWGLGGPTDRNHSCSSKLKTHWAFSTPVIAAKTRHSIAIYSRVELPVLYYNLYSIESAVLYRYTGTGTWSAPGSQGIFGPRPTPNPRCRFLKLLLCHHCSLIRPRAALQALLQSKSRSLRRPTPKRSRRPTGRSSPRYWPRTQMMQSHRQNQACSRKISCGSM